MEPQALQRGSIIDRYTVEGILGEGGMARVLRVRHNQLGTAHALKILTIHSPGIGERLLAEGRAQATLRHPNILSVTDALILDGGQPALILELVEGPSLDVLLHQRRLTLEQADALARGILAGVEEAHRHGLIHRDLKPANILLQPLDGGYQPKVADFGLVKILSGAPNSSSRTRTGSTMGTPRYMSPEQIRDSKNVDEASDVFALGAVLYELIAHEAAFGGADLLEIFNNVAASNYVPIRQHVPELPERMERAIEAALQPDPADRPASVQALAELWTDNQPLEAMPFPEVVRSLVSTPPAEEAPGSTWSGEPSRSGDSLSSSPSSQGAPSTRAAVALAGLGGGVLLLSLVGLLTVSGLAVGLWSVHSWLAPSEPTTTAISPQDPGGRPLGSPSTPPPGDPDEGETDRAITDRAITDSAITDSAITGGLVREDREERAGL
ncbi:MAG TPA: serine/threonine protein kinase, partial [Deltaproteobacteria bacterium]|nr:serine/threonine protein kinase [Deltaproteobacteria bacterium]